MRVLLLVLLVVSGCANADFYLGVYTRHFQHNDYYNNENQLMAVSHNDWIAGTAVNSYNKRTWFAGKDLWSHGNFGLTGLIVHGYCIEHFDAVQDNHEGCDAGFLPLVIPYYETSHYRAMLVGNAVSVTLRF